MYLSLSGRNITANNSEILITDTGRKRPQSVPTYDKGEALICNTIICKCAEVQCWDLDNVSFQMEESNLLQ